MKVRLLITSLLLIAAWLLQPSPLAGQEAVPDVCLRDPNQLLQNCNFSQGLNGWQTFVESGQVNFGTITGDACHAPDCPAAHVVSSGAFVGGLYQQVPATPGTAYWANVVWLVYDPAGKLDNTVGRRIGIDPTGGTDSTSPNVVWSQDLWRTFESCEYKQCPELQVSAVAQNSTITVFVRIEDTWRNRSDEFSFVPDFFYQMEEQFWIDDVGLIATDAVPAPTPVPPTPTPIPPTPTPVPPTVTPLPLTDTPTAELVATPTIEPTIVAQQPTPTPVPPTATVTPTPSPTPTFTSLPPSPTPTLLPTATPTPEPSLLDNLGLLGGGTLCLGGAGLGAVLLVGAFLYWLYRLGTSEEAFDEEFDYEDEESG